MLSTNCEEFSYPTPFLKSSGSVIRINFLEYRTTQATLFVRRNDLYALFATKKQINILNRYLSCSCSNIIYSKSVKENRKKSYF